MAELKKTGALYRAIFKPSQSTLCLSETMFADHGNLLSKLMIFLNWIFIFG